MQITLWMNTAGHAPEGPGWYIYAGAMEDAQSKGFIAAKRIATATADDLAMSFENALQGQLVEGDVTPTQLVASGSNLIRAAIQKQLDEAEDQARKIKHLRQLLQTESPVMMPFATEQE
jgi:hypothetical protein